MGDKNKIVFTIAGGIAMLFFLLTRFCIPISKENTQLSSEYNELKRQVDVLEDFNEDKYGLLGERMEAAVVSLDEKFPPEGEFKLIEYLTRLPPGSKVIFEEILQDEQKEKEGYYISPVKVSMKASFYDFMNYLTAIDTGPVMIGVNSLTINRVDPGAQALAIKIEFLGFRLVYKAPAANAYLELNEPLNLGRLEQLLEPIAEIHKQGITMKQKEYNPFLSAYTSSVQAIIEEALPEPEISGVDNLSLKGILHIENKKAALINDSVVMKGQAIGGMKVVEIRDYEVVLKRSDKKFILKMGVSNGIIKQE